MIVIDPNASFDAPVRVNKKGFVAQFGMSFKLLDQDALDALLKGWLHTDSVDAMKGADPQTAAAAKAVSVKQITDQEFIEEVATGWSDVGDTNGALAFSKENMARLCKLPGVRAAIIQAFLSGYEEAAEKNSLPPLAT